MSDDTQLATRERARVEDSGPVSFLLDTSKFEHSQRIATIMGEGSLLPDHLKHERGNPKCPPLPARTIMANCFRIVNQAFRWGMDPFSIVDETYVVGGKLGYQGKLVAAVVNSRAGLDGRLNYSFKGTGDNLTVTVSGCFKGEGGEVREVTLRLGDAKTQNQMWKADPEQKLIYSGVVKWARRHCPEVVLGVLTDDDLERMRPLQVDSHRVIDTQPLPESSKADRLADQIAAKQPDAPLATPEPTPDEQPATSSADQVERIAEAIHFAETPEAIEVADNLRKVASRKKDITADESKSLAELIAEKRQALEERPEGDELFPVGRGAEDASYYQ